MYIPDPLELLENQIDRQAENHIEGCCMQCRKKIDYELIPATDHPAAILVCYDCLSPEAQKIYDEFEKSIQPK